MLTISTDLQPDQHAERWDDHVLLYESAFEPLSVAFARQATVRLDLKPGARVLTELEVNQAGVAHLIASSGLVA